MTFFFLGTSQFFVRKKLSKNGMSNLIIDVFFAFFGSKREQRDRSKKFHVRSFSLLYNKRAREGNRRSPKGTISSHIRFFFLCCFVSTTSKKKNTGVCSKKKKKRGYQIDPKRQKPLDDKVK